MTTTPPVVSRLQDVSKRFVLRQDKSVKDRLLHPFQSKQYEKDFWALTDVNVEIQAGATIGLIGPNGSGKSTLLKVIGGIIDSDSGSVETRGRIAALLELGAGFHPDLTGRENVYLNAAILGLSEQQTEEQFEDIVAFSEIGEFIDTPVKFYSSGMYVRLAFSVAVHTDPDILLVDEVLAVGDEAFQKKCLDRIREFQQEGRTIILVTHSLATVEEMCDRAVLLVGGQITYDGEPANAVNDFRRLMEERRLQLAGEDTQARQLGRIVGSMARPFKGKTGEVLEPGGTLAIVVDLAAEQPLEGWVLCVKIRTSAGTEAYETDTARLGFHGQPLEGLRRVILRVDDLHAGAGTYVVDLVLKGPTGQTLHVFENAATFSVEADKRSLGPMYGLPSLEDRGRVE